jgi:hypothetical protein
MERLPRTNPLTLVAFAGMLLVLFPKQADAYLDPGTGSMVWQILLAVVLTLGYVTRRYWTKLRALFGSSPQADVLSETDERQP